jgi:hypothetical protein
MGVREGSVDTSVSRWLSRPVGSAVQYFEDVSLYSLNGREMWVYLPI